MALRTAVNGDCGSDVHASIHERRAAIDRERQAIVDRERQAITDHRATTGVPVATSTR